MSKNKKQCKCQNWARTDQAIFLTEHHPNCEKYDAEGDAIDLIKDLANGIESWAQETDGVYPELWDAYVKAKLVIGEINDVDLDSDPV